MNFKLLSFLTQVCNMFCGLLLHEFLHNHRIWNTVNVLPFGRSPFQSTKFVCRKHILSLLSKISFPRNKWGRKSYPILLFYIEISLQKSLFMHWKIVPYIAACRDSEGETVQYSPYICILTFSQYFIIQYFIWNGINEFSNRDLLPLSIF